jgi:hypothetical protein
MVEDLPKVTHIADEGTQATKPAQEWPRPLMARLHTCRLDSEKTELDSTLEE